MKTILLSSGTITLLVVLAVVAVLAAFVTSLYNALVRARNSVSEAFSAMDVYMKKRYDLIPNLVNTVKGYATHEKETLDAVISARNSAASATNPADQLKAEGELNQVMSRLFALTESYPDLKANTNFLDLQDKLNLVETEIAQSRKFYNATARQYNNKVQTFPSVIIANMFGFEASPMFELTDTAQRENVEVSF